MCKRYYCPPNSQDARRSIYLQAASCKLQDNQRQIKTECIRCRFSHVREQNKVLYEPYKYFWIHERRLDSLLGLAP